MQAPAPPEDRSVLASQQRASREITAGLEDEIAALHRLSAWKRCREISLFALLYAIGAFVVFHRGGFPILLPAGIAFMGVALNSLGILIHEGLHGLLARRPALNHLLSFLTGLPLGISATAYQVTHGNHHYELGRKLDYGTYRQHVRSPALVWMAYFLQLFFGTLIYIALIPFLAFRSASWRARMFIVLEYGVILAAYALLVSHIATTNLLLFWIWPLLGMSVLTNIRGLGSHALGDAGNIYLSSRTIKSSRFVSTLLLHENYHLEHHLFPGVPSYNLSKVHALIWHRLPEALCSRSFSGFLLGFFRAAAHNDLSPMGVVHPAAGSVRKS